MPCGVGYPVVLDALWCWLPCGVGCLVAWHAADLWRQPAHHQERCMSPKLCLEATVALEERNHDHSICPLALSTPSWISIPRSASRPYPKLSLPKCSTVLCMHSSSHSLASFSKGAFCTSGAQLMHPFHTGVALERWLFLEQNEDEEQGW